MGSPARTAGVVIARQARKVKTGERRVRMVGCRERYFFFPLI